MKPIIGLAMMLGLAFTAAAQTQAPVNAKSSEVKPKPTTSIPEQQLSPAMSGSGNMSGTIGSGALPPSGVIVYDSTTSSDFHYNPYRKFTPGEAAPENPAPGLQRYNYRPSRLPSTDRIREPRR